MSSVRLFPGKRKQYIGPNNPRFVSDIVNTDENLLIAMQSILGLGNTDFAIISGFDYTPGSPGTYSTGIVFMNGVFYLSNSILTEGFYLSPNVTDTLMKNFSDGTARNIYTVNYCVSSNVSVGGMPVFSGNMNQYRLNTKTVNQNLIQNISGILKAFGDNYVISGALQSGTSYTADVTSGYVYVNNQIYYLQAASGLLSGDNYLDISSGIAIITHTVTPYHFIDYSGIIFSYLNEIIELNANLASDLATYGQPTDL
jgi:hypothetical protein